MLCAWRYAGDRSASDLVPGCGRYGSTWFLNDEEVSCAKYSERIVSEGDQLLLLVAVGCVLDGKAGEYRGSCDWVGVGGG